MSQNKTFVLDGKTIPYAEGQTIIQAAMAAGVYIPHLCFNPEFKPHGSCKLCTVKADGRQTASCTQQPSPDMVVESDTKQINDERRTLLQMLFVEGNHFCPSCEKSGNCQLQATAYQMNMMSPHFDQFFPDRPLDASHPEYLLDFNRCILCSLCVRASRDVDGKNVFALSGRGIRSHLIVNAKSGNLADTDFTGDDKAAHVCPVGVILKKRVGFTTPIGCRTFDEQPISATPHPACPVGPRSDTATLPPHPQGACPVGPRSDTATLPPHPACPVSSAAATLPPHPQGSESCEPSAVPARGMR